VEKVTQFRRGRKIEVRHVIKPFALMIVGALGLLVAWTIAYPPTWKRVTSDGEDNNTFGFCELSTTFAITLDLLITVAVVTALWMSCKTRHLPEDISDSRRVFQTLTAHLVIIMSKLQ
jgi:hypothetical protein